MPGSIVVFNGKAHELRAIAARLGVRIVEASVEGDESVTRFSFDLPDQEMVRFLDEVPRELYARRAIL